MILALLATAAAATPQLTICPDRPSKANGTCTVPAGHWQLEVSGLDWTRTAADGSHIDTTSLGSTLAKYGLNGSADVEIGLSPFVAVSGPGLQASGVGDTVVRLKQQLTGPEAVLQAAVLPFVKLPSAKHPLGNGRMEGGVAIPLSTPLANSVTLSLGPELDVLANANGHGRHFALANLANVSIAASPKWTVSAELWNQQNFDPAGSQHLWSADASAAYQPQPRLQLDGGVNFGLNRSTPGAELYFAASILL